MAGWQSRCGLFFVSAVFSLAVWAGAQVYEPLAASVQTALHQAVSDQAAPNPQFANQAEEARWYAAMSQRLARQVPDVTTRLELLRSVRYEAQRSGLDAQLVLGLIDVESSFRKYAVSPAGARGYMQVMPFWIKLIGNADTNLFHLRTNLRYGCVILRHYVDLEHGDLFRALGRYNGSLGKADYPNAVRAAWQGKWRWPPA